MYDQNTVVIPNDYGKVRFSKAELRHIAMAVGMLTLAFTIVLTIYHSDYGLSGGIGWVFLYAIIISLIAVLTGFMLHELAHKVVAQRFGAWAEFRAWPFGLLIALVFSFLGFIFAAPGAVYIQGMISRRQNGEISLAGPMTNLAIGAVFLTLSVLMPTGLIGFALLWIAEINIMLSLFNLLPLPPLDGYKVIKWNVGVYLAVFMTSLVLVVIIWTGLLI